MPDPDTEAEQDSAGAEAHLEPAASDAVATTEAYETEEGMVFYDAENPLAWIQTDIALEIDETL